MRASIPRIFAPVQNAYFAAARETVERYGGVLEKYIGDAVVALFGIPRTRDDDAERAVRAGLALVGAIEQLGATVGLEPTALRVRVGVNTGEVLAGEEGPERGAATGDTVNVAAGCRRPLFPGRSSLARRRRSRSRRRSSSTSRRSWS